MQGNSAKHLPFTILFKTHGRQTFELNPVFQMRKLRLSEEGSCVQGHTAGNRFELCSESAGLARRQHCLSAVGLMLRREGDGAFQPEVEPQPLLTRRKRASTIQRWVCKGLRDAREERRKEEKQKGDFIKLTR